MKTKILIPLLALIHLLAVTATAQVNYAVSGGTASVTRSPSASGDVVIASTFNGFPVTSIEHDAFNGTGLTSVTIPDSVTSIGAEAFYFCTSLTNVNIGNSVTAVGFYVFRDCRSLTSVTIPNSVTAIGYGAFQNCTRLTSMTVPNSVTFIDQQAFNGCTSLTNAIIGNSVASIGSAAFYNCTSLTDVTIPNSVTSIGAVAFSGCTSLTNLSVDAANPTYSSLNGVLFNKAQTTLIFFPLGRGGSYFIPGSVTNIGRSAFVGCTRLTNVTIGNSVTSIGEGAFVSCSNLTSVIFGNSVTSIGFSAFVFCTRLPSVTIPASVTRIGSQGFLGCMSLTNFTFLGNPPQLLFDFDGGFAQFNFVGAGARAYYYCGTTGWGPSYGPLPTVMLCPPGIVPAGAGVKPGGFGFTLTRLTNQTIIVEASTDLLNWQPIWTNTLPGTPANFVDPEWLQQPARFYRARSE